MTNPNWGARGGVVLGKINFLKEVLQKYGVEKPLFLTETEAVLALRTASRDALGVKRKANADEALTLSSSTLTSSDASRLTSSSGDPSVGIESPLPSGERD